MQFKMITYDKFSWRNLTRNLLKEDIDIKWLKKRLKILLD